MTLLDPTLGVGYAFGEKLPSTHMTTIATQQPRALDVINGGSYVQGGAGVILDGDALKGGGGEPIQYTNILGIASPNAETRWRHPCVLEDTMGIVAGGDVTNVAGTINQDNIMRQTGQCDNIGAAINYDAATVATWTGTSNLPRCGTRTYVFSQPKTAGKSSRIVATLDDWIITSGPTEQLRNLWGQDTVVAGNFVAIPVTRAINQSTITRIDVRLWGNAFGGAAHVGLPVVMPEIRLIRQDNVNGNASLVSFAQDTSTLLQYDSPHTVSAIVGGGGEFMNQGFEYFVRVDGESGVNAAADHLAIIAVEVSYECIAIGPG